MIKKERDYAFLLRLTADEKKNLEKYALRFDLSQAQVVRRALDKFFSKERGFDVK